MRQFWISLFGAMLGVILAMLLLAVLAGMAISAWFAGLAQDQAAADRGDGAVVLEVDLRTARLDQPAASPFPAAGPIAMIELLTALDRAASDPTVASVFIRAGAGVTPADAEEVRAALQRVRQAGKPVIAHIQSFTGSSLSPYHAVSGASEIWMHPSGWFAATGLRTEQVFFGDALIQLGAEAQFLQLFEYKGAAEIFTRTDYSEAAREATQAWLSSLYATAIAEIAVGRQLSLEEASRIISAGPYLANQAQEAGLVDQLGQAEAARTRALAAAPRTRLETIDAYARRQRQPADGAVIALISGQGPVVDGPAPRGFGASAALASDPIAEAIDAAAADPTVRAILIRLDTGGGSATASDQIAAAILRARRGGTPVVVSMGSVAASGGYYIAAPADHITANAGTLTGSIGVISGKIALGGALERAGVTFDSVTVGGAFTGALSTSERFTEAQQAAIEAMAEATYADFTALVAEGRDLPLARVEDLARGRVWTGAQAAELGLVDEIGGFLDAVDAARRLARLSPDEAIRLQPFPAPPRGLDRLRAMLGAGVESGEALAALSAVLNRPEVQTLLREMEQPAAPVALEADTPN
jgi:protease-4